MEKGRISCRGEIPFTFITPQKSLSLSHQADHTHSHRRNVRNQRPLLSIPPVCACLGISVSGYRTLSSFEGKVVKAARLTDTAMNVSWRKAEKLMTGKCNLE
ncbi:MAG: hypothetical protein ACYS0I_16905 [Planctomycetota bacterium]|jgi:hypothetical protein